MRLFLSIDPPLKLKLKLSEVQDKWRPGLEAVFVSPKNFHLTILFLGEVSRDRLDGLKDICSETSLIFERFFLTVGTFDFLTQGRQGSVVLKLGKNQTLEALRNSLKSRFLNKKFLLKESTFSKTLVPHITLCRFKKNISPEFRAEVTALLSAESLSPEDYPWEADSFFLTESLLGPGGLVYSHLAQFILKKGVK